MFGQRLQVRCTMVDLEVGSGMSARRVVASKLIISAGVPAEWLAVEDAVPPRLLEFGCENIFGLIT